MNQKALTFTILKEPLIKNTTNSSRSTWTKDACRKEASKFESRSEWREKSTASYKKAARSGWIQEFMPIDMKHVDYSSFAQCAIEAELSQSEQQWKEDFPDSYFYAVQNRWVEICCTNIILRNAKSGILVSDLEDCINSAARYQSITEWSMSDQKTYRIAYIAGIVKACSQHMSKKNKRRTISDCIQISKKYKSPKEWKDHDPLSYISAKRRGLFNSDCTKILQTT
ncbi:hypothetical protein [Photobacterium kishitanii]|uniref:Uncharacterized protein n=1 Tax=Photobacterium kishitanii TaxID=318456 RepID=A0A2T3KLI2_9GAMM|nr:hypothetical protein [Photobacterium kishitanii]PSV00562.1 hypothetical protein C9J27_05350 [Photobacterium kishitanii]